MWAEKLTFIVCVLSDDKNGVSFSGNEAMIGSMYFNAAQWTLYSKRKFFLIKKYLVERYQCKRYTINIPADGWSAYFKIDKCWPTQVRRKCSKTVKQRHVYNTVNLIIYITIYHTSPENNFSYEAKLLLILKYLRCFMKKLNH